jgi:hypothetical protein
MPPKPSDPLKQHIGGAEPGNKKISVNIQGLFQYLGSHQDTAFGIAH